MATFQHEGEAGRFHSAAGHYLAGRPPYADRLFRRVATLVGLGSRDAVLDLGCGPGQIARAFARLAGGVVAMDPEPAMLLVAAETSAGYDNINFIEGGSEDIGPGLGRFRIVAMGRSFHWMDRAETLRRLNGLVEPGGAVVLFHTTYADVPENHWVDRFNAIRRRYSGDEPRHRGSGWTRHEAALLDSPFAAVEACSVYERRTFDAQRLLDRIYSMSSTSPAKLGDRARDLERDIAALIDDIAPDGVLAEVICSTALVARRPHEEIVP